MLAIGLLCLLALAAAWWAAHRDAPIDNLAFTPASSDADAKVLVQRMLQVNRPWLEPRSVHASYSLHRDFNEFSLLHGHQENHGTLGPFSIVPGCKQALRIGLTVETPLHAMVGESTNYTVRMLGETKWRKQRVLGVEVSFASPVRCAVGMGGQKISYSFAGYQAKEVRILIDPEKAVPLLLRTSAELNIPRTPKLKTVWEFSPQFLELDDGLAPRALDWRDNSNVCREHQEFQVVNGIWLFSRGRSVISTGGGYGGLFSNLLRRILTMGHDSQELQLVGFELTGGEPNPGK
jgi:hypothetical protein